MDHYVRRTAFNIHSPEGVIACVTKNGQYLGVYQPGRHYCLPWTEAQYLITKQNIVFDMPVASCPTSDNIFVSVSKVDFK